MITAEILRILARRCPNYHILAAKFVKGHMSVCSCAACQFSINLSKNPNAPKSLACARVIDDMIALKCSGHALVSIFGTCDAARFSQEKYDNFHLEGDRIAPDAPGHAQERETESGQANISPAEKAQDDALQLDPMRYEMQTIPIEDHYVEES